MEDGRRALLSEGGGEAEALQEYRGEFLRLRTLAITRLQVLRDGEAEGPEALQLAERALEEMEGNRRLAQVQVRLELSGAQGSRRQEWELRVQGWAREAALLRSQLEELKEAQSRQKLRLPGQGQGAQGGLKEASQGSLGASGAVGTELLERSSRQLEEARRTALETEDIGTGVLSDLAAQRDTIRHMRDSMRTVDAELSAARQALSRMLLTAQRNRLVTLVIAAILGLGICFWLLCTLKLPVEWNLGLLAALLVAALLCFLWRRSRRLRTG